MNNRSEIEQLLLGMLSAIWRFGSFEHLVQTQRVGQVGAATKSFKLSNLGSPIWELFRAL